MVIVRFYGESWWGIRRTELMSRDVGFYWKFWGGLSCVGKVRERCLVNMTVASVSCMHATCPYRKLRS